jgi:hypothetical protein
MTPNTIATRRWSTAAFGDAAETSPIELCALGEHFGTCQGTRGRLFSLHCAAETLHGFVAPRLVTTLAVAALLIGAGSLIG